MPYLELVFNSFFMGSFFGFFLGLLFGGNETVYPESIPPEYLFEICLDEQPAEVRQEATLHTAETIRGHLDNLGITVNNIDAAPEKGCILVDVNSQQNGQILEPEILLRLLSPGRGLELRKIWQVTDEKLTGFADHAWDIPPLKEMMIAADRTGYSDINWFLVPESKMDTTMEMVREILKAGNLEKEVFPAWQAEPHSELIGEETQRYLSFLRAPEYDQSESGPLINESLAQLDYVGAWGVAVTLTDNGQTFFSALSEWAYTGGNLPIAILINGEIYSAPIVMEPIYGKEITISGNFTKEKTELLARQLLLPALDYSGRAELLRIHD